MKKTILTSMVLILILFWLPSCAGVSQEEYDRVSSDLAAAQTQIQSLQADLSKAQAQIQSLQGDLTEAQAQIQSLQSDIEVADKNPAEALAYAEFLDILMYHAFRDCGITPRFTFEDDIEWLVEVRSRASDIGGTELSGWIKELERHNEAVMSDLWDYCLGGIEKALK